MYPPNMHNAGWGAKILAMLMIALAPNNEAGRAFGFKFKNAQSNISHGKICASVKTYRELANLSVQFMQSIKDGYTNGNQIELSGCYCIPALFVQMLKELYSVQHVNASKRLKYRTSSACWFIMTKFCYSYYGGDPNALKNIYVVDLKEHNCNLLDKYRVPLGMILEERFEFSFKGYNECTQAFGTSNTIIQNAENNERKSLSSACARKMSSKSGWKQYKYDIDWNITVHKCLDTCNVANTSQNILQFKQHLKKLMTEKQNKNWEKWIIFDEEKTSFLFTIQSNHLNVCVCGKHVNEPFIFN